MTAMTAAFSLRIVVADYYTSKPISTLDEEFSEFRNSAIERVPIIRIFGSTPKGQKACLHVHDVYPYFYVPLPEYVKDEKQFCLDFASSMDSSLHVALGKSVTSQQYVYKITIEKKFPFYGYYEERQKFLKIFLYNPNLISRAAELVLSGGVLNQMFQPFETHIPYILQFLIDYNLSGMNFIHLSNVEFRQPLPKPDENSPKNPFRSPLHSPLGSPILSQINSNIFDDSTVPNFLLLTPGIAKQTTCPLEVDVLGKNIKNKDFIQDSVGKNPGLALLWEDEKMRRRENNESSFISMPESQARDRYEKTELERIQLERLKNNLDARASLLYGSLSESPAIQSSFTSPRSDDNSRVNLSIDTNLVDLLVDMPNDSISNTLVDMPNDSISNTPLSETTFVNNGISDEQNPCEDNDEEESIMMSQKLQNIFDEGERKDNDESSGDEGERKENDESSGDEDDGKMWSNTFLNQIPQLDGSCDTPNDTPNDSSVHPIPQVNTFCDTLNDSSVHPIPQLKTVCDTLNDSSVHPIPQVKTVCDTLNTDQIFKTNKSLMVPQIDGHNSSESSEEDFQLNFKNKNVSSRRSKRHEKGNRNTSKISSSQGSTCSSKNSTKRLSQAKSDESQNSKIFSQVYSDISQIKICPQLQTKVKRESNCQLYEPLKCRNTQVRSTSSQKHTQNKAINPSDSATPKYSRVPYATRLRNAKSKLIYTHGCNDKEMSSEVTDTTPNSSEKLNTRKKKSNKSDCTSKYPIRECKVVLRDIYKENCSTTCNVETTVIEMENSFKEVICVNDVDSEGIVVEVESTRENFSDFKKVKSSEIQKENTENSEAIPIALPKESENSRNILPRDFETSHDMLPKPQLPSPFKYTQQCKNQSLFSGKPLKFNLSKKTSLKRILDVTSTPTVDNVRSKKLKVDHDISSSNEQMETDLLPLNSDFRDILPNVEKITLFSPVNYNQNLCDNNDETSFNDSDLILSSQRHNKRKSLCSVPTEDLMQTKQTEYLKEKSFKNMSINEEQLFKNTPTNEEQSCKNTPTFEQQLCKNTPINEEQLFKNTPTNEEQSCKNTPTFEQQLCKNTPINDEQSCKNTPTNEEQSCKNTPTNEEQSCKNTSINEEQLCKNTPTNEEQSCKNTPTNEEQSFKNTPDIEEQSCKNTPDIEEQSCKNTPTNEEQSCKNTPTNEEQSCKNTPTNEEQSYKNTPTNEEQSYKNTPDIEEQSCKNTPTFEQQLCKNTPINDEQSCKNTPTNEEQLCKNTQLVEKEPCKTFQSQSVIYIGERSIKSNTKLNDEDAVKTSRVEDKMIHIKPVFDPPTKQEILDSLVKYSLNEYTFVKPFYSKEKDVASASKVHSGHTIVCNVKEKTKDLPEFDSKYSAILSTLQKNQLHNFDGSILQDLVAGQVPMKPSELNCALSGDENLLITPLKQPPSFATLQRWHEKSYFCNSSSERNNTLENNEQTNSQLLKATPSTSLAKNDDKTAEKQRKFRSLSQHKRPVIKQMKHLVLDMSVIEGLSPDNSYAFKFPSQKMSDVKALHLEQHLTVLSIELHVNTRRDYRPDPSIDCICAIFYYYCKDPSVDNLQKTRSSGAFIFCEGLHSSVEKGTLTKQVLYRLGINDFKCVCFDDEYKMLIDFASFVQKVDPDIVVGYEVQMFSWGYLIERATTLEINMTHKLSRLIDLYNKPTVKTDSGEDNWYGQLVSMSIPGRIILNVWRVMRSEVTLQIYTYENVLYHVLHRRVPKYSFKHLTNMWHDVKKRWRVFEYYMERCQGNVELLDQIDFINRTSELARIFGILFYAVISRGSQFRVESMMLRVGKPLDFVPISPSVHQRAQMAAPECIPLVMEPESKMYVDPVIVLDFQSLYPSIIIGYNYCYSTCLGRVNQFAVSEKFPFGATSLNVPIQIAKKLLDDKKVHISPNGVGFVTSDVRRGILPRMLEEILNTRLMVKGAMKKNRDDKVLHKMLDSRQLGLKLIANVTYGYTSANFSGRMPCIEIGDSVVRKGRETLERAIQLVNTTEKWNARVVYGDTDSLFVLLKGASKETAFRIGKEIVDEVTALNPKPVKLKFEKVYQPCVLITKKRYVGYMYETLDQTQPVFDAKGIETIRRDNCPAVGKILEKCLRMLFDTKDVSLVKSYVQRQFDKITQGRVTMKDYIFAKEYRGMSTYKPGACVPALMLTRKMLKSDRRAEPRIGERVPYVIVHGDPKLPLIQLVKTPLEVIENPGLRINDIYYITKQICPALGRIFSLFGVNVQQWYFEMPKVSRVQERELEVDGKRKGTISHYFASTHCTVCRRQTTKRLCNVCVTKPQETVVILNCRMSKTEKRFYNLSKLCQHCSGCHSENVLDCISLDCPNFFKLSNIARDMSRIDATRNLIQEMF